MNEGEARDRRGLVNLIAVIAILLLAIGAVWLLRQIDQSRKIEACLEAGRRDCAKIVQPDASPP